MQILSGFEIEGTRIFKHFSCQIRHKKSQDVTPLQVTVGSLFPKYKIRLQ
jgi:hypothetical protein